MTKKELFTKAHEMTREIARKFPNVHYRAQFSICLKELYKQIDKKDIVQSSINNEVVESVKEKKIESKIVTINGIERSVTIKIKGAKMIGFLGESKFMWNYITNDLPSVEVEDGGDKVKAARYGRLFILERLKMDNIILPIKDVDNAVQNSSDKNVKVLTEKTVELNGFKRSVVIKIEGTKMSGLLNKTPFEWNYTQHEVPNIIVKDGSDKVKAAKYGRLYILERLKMDNIVLPIKTKESTVNYIHIDNADGVWINCFENGYLRGEVNGTPFVWNPSIHKNAVAVNTPGFKGGITNKIDTSLIKKRLKDAGYASYKDLMATINGKEVPVIADPVVDSNVVVTNNKTKSVCIYASRGLVVNYNQDHTVLVHSANKEFKYNSLIEAYSSTLGEALYDATHSYVEHGCALDKACEIFEGYITAHILDSGELDTINSVIAQFKDHPDVGMSIISSLIFRGELREERIVNKEDVTYVIQKHINDLRGCLRQRYYAHNARAQEKILRNVFKSLHAKGQKSTSEQLSSAVC